MGRGLPGSAAHRSQILGTEIKYVVAQGGAQVGLNHPGPEALIGAVPVINERGVGVVQLVGQLRQRGGLDEHGNQLPNSAARENSWRKAWNLPSMSMNRSSDSDPPVTFSNCARNSRRVVSGVIPIWCPPRVLRSRWNSARS